MHVMGDLVCGDDPLIALPDSSTSVQSLKKGHSKQPLLLLIVFEHRLISIFGEPSSVEDDLSDIGSSRTWVIVAPGTTTSHHSPVEIPAAIIEEDLFRKDSIPYEPIVVAAAIQTPIEISARGIA